MLTDILRDWAHAERLAIQAEELVRSALKDHLNIGAPRPPAEMEARAKELRSQADVLFAQVRERDKKTAGSERRTS